MSQAEIQPSEIQPVIQTTSIDKLLTPRAREIAGVQFIVGVPVSTKEGGFFGKESVLRALETTLMENGIAILEGGHRSGKTSLLKVIGERLRQRRQVERVVVSYLSDYNPSDSPDKIMAHINSEIKKGKKALIIVDEIEAYSNRQSQVELLKLIQQLKEGGHRVIFSVIGDLHGNSPKELPRETKDKLLEMGNNVTIVNELLTDGEIRELLVQGGLFTKPLVEYLTTEAGGHPYLAAALGQLSMFLLRDRKVEPTKFVKELRSAIKEDMLGNFEAIVDKVIAAGFDPLTWEWKGQGESPNIEVYKNMLPRSTSTLFKDWLTAYIEKRQRPERIV